MILRKVALAAMILGGAASEALAEINYLAFSSEPSTAREAALGYFEAAAGTTIDPGAIAISEIDLDDDGTIEIIAYANSPAFCNPDGCAPKILRREDETWKDVLAEGLVRTRAVPGNVSRVAMTTGTFWGLMFGSLLLEWDGTRYREYQPPPVTQLDDAAFLAACTASPVIVRYVEDADARVSEPLPTFCDCLASQFENAGLPQGELDLFTKQLADKVPDDNVGTLVSSPKDYLYRINDYKLSCRIELTVD